MISKQKFKCLALSRYPHPDPLLHILEVWAFQTRRLFYKIAKELPNVHVMEKIRGDE